MADADPQPFAPRADAPLPLRIAALVVHRSFETDRDGLTSIHVWITAEATPPDEPFQSLTADVAFVLHHGDDELGTCRAKPLTFAAVEPQTLHADETGLRIAASAKVTAVTAQIEVLKVMHTTAEQAFDPK